jgi:hypothetical protein
MGVHLLCMVPARLVVVMQAVLSFVFAGSYKRLKG